MQQILDLDKTLKITENFDSLKCTKEITNFLASLFVINLPINNGYFEHINDTYYPLCICKLFLSF